MRTLGGSGHALGPRPSAALSAVVCHQSRMHTPAPGPASAVVPGPRVRAKRPPASIVRRRFRAHALRPVPSAVVSVLSVVFCRSPVHAPASEPGLAGSGATDDVSVAEKTSVTDSFKDFLVVQINRPNGHVAAHFDLVLLYGHVPLRLGGCVGCLGYGPRVFIAIDVSRVNRRVRRFGEHPVGSITQVLTQHVKRGPGTHDVFDCGTQEKNTQTLNATFGGTLAVSRAGLPRRPQSRGAAAFTHRIARRQTVRAVCCRTPRSAIEPSS